MKSIVLFSLFSVCASAQAAAPVNGGLVVTTSPTPAVALSGGTITFTANRPVNFAIAPGSLGKLTTVDATHATYTAPDSAIPVQTQYGGCPTGPNDSIMNQPITKVAVDSRSANWLSQLSGYHVSMDTAYPRNIETDPAFPLILRKFGYGSPSMKYPELTGMFKREGGQLSNSGGVDHHTITVLVNAGGVPGSCRWFETYQDIVPLPALASTYKRCQDGTNTCNASSGASYSGTSYAAYPSGTNVPGMTDNVMISLAEIKNNTIHHPLKMVLVQGFEANTYLWPGNYSNGWATHGTGVPFGARLRLNPAKMAAHNASNPGSDPAISTYSQYAQNILNAWVNYGLIDLDSGSTATTTYDEDVYEDPAVVSAIYEVAKYVTLGDFDIVATQADPGNRAIGNGLQLSPRSLEVNPYNTASSTGTNVPPVGFAAVKATDRSPVHGKEYSVVSGIDLRGVAIGIPQAQLTMLAATRPYTYQLTSWVTGSTNQRVAWVLTSGPGSVTTGGLYTVPTNVKVSSPTAVTLTGTAAADASATVTQYIEIIPASPDGNWREVMSFTSVNDSSTPSHFTWWPYYGLESGGVTFGGEGMSGLTGQEVPVYNKYAYTSDDLHFHFIVPNGTYKVRLLNVESCNGSMGCPKAAVAGWHSPLFINVNNQFDSQNYQWGAGVGYMMWKPWDYYAPALVTSQTLDLWEGAVYPFNSTAGSQAGPIMSAVEVMPDRTAAHIAIDTGLEQWSYTTGEKTTPAITVAAKATYQFNVVGWYMNNSATWTTTLGHISSAGLFTAPAATVRPQTVTITATSTVNPSLTAVATVTVPGSGP